MEHINIILAHNIKNFRKQCNLTQYEFAERLGVTYQAVSKWENAKSTPDVLFFPLIADIFECSIDGLFSHIPKRKTDKINMLPGDSVPEGMKKHLADQIRCQLDNEGSTNKFLEVMTDNLSGDFELIDENIERLLDAYRDLYRGMRKKK